MSMILKSDKYSRTSNMVVINMCRLPGKAYARRQHVWLTGANEVDSKTFSRAILAKVSP